MEKIPNVEIVFHYGDYGKEPMIIIFGKNPYDILDKVKKIIFELTNTRSLA